jgi:Dihydroorotate dehydrogenase/Iron-sulfur cluster binding domain of dihydroorotate dehydrogenase B
MLEAVAELCSANEVPYQLAEESPMACGFGACYGCAVPRPGGGYLRLCVDGPVLPAGGDDREDSPDRESPRSETGPAGRGSIEFCGIELENPVINASRTYDAIAARKVFGDELLEEFPFAAFVSKTITPEPRAGNEPRRLWETPAGMINSIGLPNKGLAGFLAEDLPQLAELPVPLIVSVMATNRELFARLLSGISSGSDAAEFLFAGASLVAVGTESFAIPGGGADCK